MDEIQEVIRKFKRNKATGPDEIPIEIFKELETRALEHIATALNIWWDDEAIEEEHLRAPICLIYKKGSTANMENFRPIALLNTMYKIFIAILQKRLAATIDKHLQKTQFGFRKDKSTADALHCIRRIMENATQTKDKTILVLIDWRKHLTK